MTNDPSPEPNIDALQRVLEYNILNTPAEEPFDDLARLAAQICNTPYAFISFLDHQRLWNKSRIGMVLTEFPLPNSIFATALRETFPTIISDAENLQNLAPGIPLPAFLAAAPLIQPKLPGSSQSATIGLLLVLHTKKHSIAPEQIRALQILAAEVMTHLELRKSQSEITKKHKDLEQALLHSESFYHSLVETIPQNIFRKDRQGRFTFANSRFCESVNRPLSDVIGKTDFDLFSPELAAKYQQDDRRVLDRRCAFKTIEEHKDQQGNTLFVQVIKSPLFTPNGDLVGVQGIFWDETDRYKAEEALAYERDLLRAMLDHLPDSIYFKDCNSRFLAMSRSLAIRLGLARPEDAIGKTDADFFDSAHARTTYEDEQRIIRTGQPIVAKAERETWLDGRERWVLTTKVPLRNSVGEIQGTFGISKDITELKLTEMELASARDAALESARLKSEFLANMSHEIRTPLNGVMGMTGLLLDTELSTEQREFAETIRKSADGLLDIINDILDFSKIEAGKMPIDLIDFDLAEAVESTTEILGESAQAKNIELASWIHEEVPRQLRGDPGRIRQVLTNLIGNAIKFTSQGEVIAEISKVRETEKTVLLKFSVRDTGIGIPPEAQGRLFEAFVQADGSTTRRYGGTGLGLAISRQLVHLMHGEMGFESAAGKGSTFWFILPFEKQTEPKPGLPIASTLEGIRVLIVDDNKTNRDIIHHQVLSWKMRNGSADSGPVALTILQAAADEGDPYQLVILDMQMPEMDGLTLARSIKSNPALSDTKLLMLTSMGHLAEEKKWRDSGISAYLVKPVKELRLYETLVTTLRGVRSRLPKNPDTNIQSRPTLKILVAEDNVVNQKVALHQLQKLGYSADAVANGQEVLQALEQIHYDIVLMDCQMPELDGYETTRIIRSKESKAPTPIRPIYVIAMTANALTGDREQCMASGMNDYIAKPVRMDELEGALSRGLNQINAPEQNDPASLLDMSIIDGLKELREPGEPDPVLELVTLFCQDAPHRIADIEAAYQAKDLDALDKTAHSLKGSSSNLGAKRVTELAREIMEKARAGILPDAQLVHDLRPEFAKAKALLEKIAAS